MRKQKTISLATILTITLFGAMTEASAAMAGVPLGPLYGQTKGPFINPYDHNRQILADKTLLSATITALENFSGRVTEEQAVTELDAYLRQYGGTNGSIRDEADPALRSLYVQIAISMGSKLPIATTALLTQIPFYPAYATSPFAPGLLEIGGLIGEDNGKSASKGGRHIKGVVNPLADQIGDSGLRSYAKMLANAYLYRDSVALVAAQSAMRIRMSRVSISPRDVRLSQAVLEGIRHAATMDSTVRKEKSKGP